MSNFSDMLQFFLAILHIYYIYSYRLEKIPDKLWNKLVLFLSLKSRGVFCDLVQIQLEIFVPGLESLISIANMGTNKFERQCLKGVFAKNERGYRRNAKKKSF